MADKKDPVILVDTAPEILASEIKAVADAAKKLLNSKLEKRAILVLLKDMSGYPMAQIEKILDCASRLDTFIKKEKR